MDFWCFLAIFELMSDSLTTTQVEPKQCPSHQSILLIQGTILLNFAKKYWKLTVWQNEVFLSRPFWFFFFKKKIVLSQRKQAACSYENHFFSALWMAVPTNMHTTVNLCTQFFLQFSYLYRKSINSVNSQTHARQFTKIGIFVLSIKPYILLQKNLHSIVRRPDRNHKH